MIRCRYDVSEPSVTTIPGAGGGKVPSRGSGYFGRPPVNRGSSVRAPLPTTTKRRQPYVHEKYLPTEGLLDPCNLTPNLHLVFEDHLDDIQQHRLLRRMEKERYVQSAGVKVLEEERRIREEADRLSSEAKQELSELQALERRLAKVSTSLEKKTIDRRSAHVMDEKVFDDEESAMKSRELKRIQSGRRWALYQAVQLDEDGEELLLAASSPTTGDTNSAETTPSRAAPKARPNYDKVFYGTPSPGRGAAVSSSTSPPTHTRTTIQSTSATPSNPASLSSKSPTAAATSTPRRPEDISSAESPPRFEETEEKRKKMNALYGDKVDHIKGTVDPVGGLAGRGAPPVPGRGGSKRRRFIVDL